MFNYCAIDPQGKAHRTADRAEFARILKQLRTQFPEQHIELSANFEGCQPIGQILTPVLDEMAKARKASV